MPVLRVILWEVSWKSKSATQAIQNRLLPDNIYKTGVSYKHNGCTFPNREYFFLKGNILKISN